MPVSVAAKNICPVIGEGPHWEENSKSLLFVDITTAGYYRWNSLDGTCEEIHADSGLAGFIIPRQNGGYLVSNDARILHLDFASRKLEPFLTIQPDELDLHLNDAKCDSKGRLWAGTMGRFNTVSDFVKEAGCLYRIDKDLKPFVVKEKTNVSNGITWTTDEKTMFYTHSIPRKIFSYYYDIHSGEASREQVVVDFTDKEWSEYGIPDGMTMDVMDKLWVAAFKSSRVFQIDPETGKILQTIKFPVSEITSCCFGGPNYDELYVTSSHLGLTDEEFKNNEPLAGSLFKVTETGAKGRAAFSFQG
uniref:Regucalcin n=3 Tax=Octopus bimaculoides TaxID=37653 RepID=A0A0L8FYD7_OCTBM